METKQIITIFLFTLIIALVVFVVVYSEKKEGFRKCICSSEQGGRERECQDTVTVNNLYVTGDLTEFSQLQGKGWGTVSPGDVDFPLSDGCDWPNASTPGKGWVSWDFTDFGS